MISNGDLTLYHKGLNSATRLETWTRYNYNNIWWFGSKGASINDGYTDSDGVNVRIPYEGNTIDTSVIAIGDILVKGTLTQEITSQQDLASYEIYNITNIKNNNFGTTPHIHLEGR